MPQAAPNKLFKDNDIDFGNIIFRSIHSDTFTKSSAFSVLSVIRSRESPYASKKGFVFYTRYQHVDNILVSVGERVVAGQQIASIAPFAASAPHLHFVISDSDGPYNWQGQELPIGGVALFVDDWFGFPTEGSRVGNPADRNANFPEEIISFMRQRFYLPVEGSDWKIMLSSPFHTLYDYYAIDLGRASTTSLGEPVYMAFGDDRIESIVDSITPNWESYSVLVRHRIKPEDEKDDDKYYFWGPGGFVGVIQPDASELSNLPSDQAFVLSQSAATGNKNNLTPEDSEYPITPYCIYTQSNIDGKGLFNRKIGWYEPRFALFNGEIVPDEDRREESVENLGLLEDKVSGSIVVRQIPLHESWFQFTAKYGLKYPIIVATLENDVLLPKPGQIYCTDPNGIKGWHNPQDFFNVYVHPIIPTGLGEECSNDLEAEAPCYNMHTDVQENPDSPVPAIVAGLGNKWTYIGPTKQYQLFSNESEWVNIQTYGSLTTEEKDGKVTLVNDEDSDDTFYGGRENKPKWVEIHDLTGEEESEEEGEESSGESGGEGGSNPDNIGTTPGQNPSQEYKPGFNEFGNTVCKPVVNVKDRGKFRVVAYRYYPIGFFGISPPYIYYNGCTAKGRVYADYDFLSEFISTDFQAYNAELDCVRSSDYYSYCKIAKRNWLASYPQSFSIKALVKGASYNLVPQNYNNRAVIGHIVTLGNRTCKDLTIGSGYLCFKRVSGSCNINVILTMKASNGKIVVYELQPEPIISPQYDYRLIIRPKMFHFMEISVVPEGCDVRVEGKFFIYTLTREELGP